MTNAQLSRENDHVETSRSLHRPSLYGGLALMALWFAYAIFLILSSFELPDGGEALSLLAVGGVMFALGWAAVRIGSHLMNRLHRCIVSGW
jgi:hypothetical protein